MLWTGVSMCTLTGLQLRSSIRSKLFRHLLICLVFQTCMNLLYKLKTSYNLEKKHDE